MSDLCVTLTITVDTADVPGAEPRTQVDLLDTVADVLETATEIGGVPIRNITVEDCHG